MDFDTSPEERASLLAFFKRQFLRETKPLSRDEVDLTGQIGIVTGGNAGLGLECCRQFLDLGLTKLIIAVRNEAKGNAARESLLAGRSSQEQVVEVWNLDMASYESVTAFAERAATLDRLDFAILNAGISKMGFDLVESTGHEETFQVNYLSTVLLTLLLLPVVSKLNTTNNPSRIVLVNSDTAAWAAFNERSSSPLLPAFDDPKFFGVPRRYACTKLLVQLFLAELAKRVPSSHAIINAANPGWCYGTGMVPNPRWYDLRSYVGPFFVRVMGRAPAVGARALVDAAVRQGEESHGQYVEDGAVQPMAPLVYSEEGRKIAGVLWEETMEELPIDQTKLAEIFFSKHGSGA